MAEMICKAELKLVLSVIEYVTAKPSPQAILLMSFNDDCSTWKQKRMKLYKELNTFSSLLLRLSE